MSKALYLEVNLWRCVTGDELLRRDGKRAFYNEFITNATNPHECFCVHAGAPYYSVYTSNGMYSDQFDNPRDIVAILTGRGRTK